MKNYEKLDQLKKYLYDAVQQLRHELILNSINPFEAVNKFNAQADYLKGEITRIELLNDDNAEYDDSVEHLFK